MQPISKDFIVHSCEQVLRFTQVNEWNDLSEERKVQLGFNMGAVALGLNLSKDEGFIALSNARTGIISMKQFHEHIQSIILSHNVNIDQAKVARPF